MLNTCLVKGEGMDTISERHPSRWQQSSYQCLFGKISQSDMTTYNYYHQVQEFFTVSPNIRRDFDKCLTEVTVYHNINCSFLNNDSLKSLNRLYFLNTYWVWCTLLDMVQNILLWILSVLEVIILIFKMKKTKRQNSKYLSEISQLASVRIRLPGYGPVNAIPSLSLTFFFVAVLISNL